MNETVVLTPERFSKSPRTCCYAPGWTKATVVDVARALDVSTAASTVIRARLRCARPWRSAGSNRANAPLEKIGGGSGRARPADAGCARCLRSSTKSVRRPEISRPIWRWRRKRVRRLKAHKERLCDQVLRIFCPTA